MKIVTTIFYIIMCATFLQCSNDDLFAAGRASQASSRSTSPQSPLVSPEELAPERPPQPNLLLQAIIKSQEEYNQAAGSKSTWKWYACQSLSRILFYGAGATILLQASDNFSRCLSIVPTYFTAVSSFMLACEIKHFRTSNDKMNQALRNASNYCTDEQIEELKQLSYSYNNSLSREFIRKIENHRNLLK